MSNLKRVAQAAFLLGSAVTAPALAADGPAYPLSYSAGENSTIEYGPGPRGAVVGGGRTVVTGSGEDARAEYLDAEYAQRPQPNLIPMSVGSGEGSSIIYVPADQARAYGLAPRRAPRG